MQALRRAILISTAAIGMAGFAGAAAAQTNDLHVMTVRLPDGTIEQIRYSGDRPPQVRLNRQPAPLVGLADFDPFASDPIFADLARLSAAMDREAADMFRRARSSMSATGEVPPGLLSIDFGKLPPGVQGYRVVSTMTGGKVCTRTVEYFSNRDGKPRVVTRSSGNCAVPENHPLRARSPRPSATTQAPRLIEASYRVPGTGTNVNDR